MNLRYSILWIASLVVLMTGFSSCRREIFGVDGHGPSVTETRNLSNFSGINLSIDADVVMHIDSTYHVVITAQQNVLEVLETDVRGGKLNIDFERNVYSHSNITVHVYAPAYTFCGISGSGNITCNDLINAGSFETSISGSGDINISNLTATDYKSRISGSGGVSIAGTAQNIRTETSGSGNTHLFDLIGQTGDVQISGSGNAEINVAQTLKVRISGSGDVYYKQTPALDIEISGSGKVQHVQ